MLFMSKSLSECIVGHSEKGIEIRNGSFDPPIAMH
jgi:hypothetical protein